jgi:hypothetical protein
VLRLVKREPAWLRPVSRERPLAGPELAPVEPMPAAGRRELKITLRQEKIV